MAVVNCGDEIKIHTGRATFHLGLSELLLRALPLGTSAESGVCESWPQLTDSAGRVSGACVRSSCVETAGAVRTTIRLEGEFSRTRGLRFVARFSFFAGTGLLLLRLAVHNPRSARHPGGLWDLGDRGSMLFRDLTIRVRPGGSAARSVWWKAEAEQPPTRLSGSTLEIFQASSGGEHWDSRNHVNRDGRVPCPFRGYSVVDSNGRRSGLRASPSLIWQAGDVAVAVAIPEFWQQFPKALDLDADALNVRLFPQQWPDWFELQGGERKTHAVWLRFGSAGEVGPDDLDWVHHPARVSAAPNWHTDSGAIPSLSTSSSDVDQRFQHYLAGSLRGATSLLAKREVIDEYGWRNFGDVWADHEGAYYPGPPPVISHYNNQFDVVYGCIQQYLRSGEVAWFDLFDSLARHVMDIDIYHTTEDKAAYSGGLFWFTDHYLDAATSTHRTYSRANRPSDGRDYGGGPGSEHNFATGLLFYYYLTGAAEAREAVLGLADWVFRMDDGARNVLGILDEGPTGLASVGGGGAMRDPGRGAANSIQVLLDAYVLSEKTCYLAKAEQIIRRCIHPLDDLAAHSLLDAEHHWSYTMFLAALSRYLHVKEVRNHLDGMYDYAQQSLLHYARWMVRHERPYLDHPEQLEYVTEAWAAQEFRKANVLRLAARHADSSEAVGMLGKANELADRAWRDLLSFETCHFTRAIAVLLTEGTIDAYFRRHGRLPPAPKIEEPFAVAPAEVFVPQRQRVGRQLRTIGGWFRAAGHIADFRRWKRFLRFRSGTESLEDCPMRGNH